MIVSLLLLVCYVDVYQVRVLSCQRPRSDFGYPNLGASHLYVMHFHDLLLIGALSFTLPMIKRGLSLLASILNFLTSSIITSFSFL